MATTQDLIQALRSGASEPTQRNLPLANALRGSMSATPRNKYLGAASDFFAQAYAPERTQQMQGVSKFLGIPAVSQTLDRLSYGEPLTTGAGGLGGTTRIRPEALEAAMLVAPMGKPAAMATAQTAKLADRAAMAVGKAGERYAEKIVPDIMQNGGFGAEMLNAMSSKTISPLDVFHGSPYKFDKFDMSKVGTGEGKELFGHGIYTTDARSVAEQYKNQLAGDGFLVDGQVFDPSSLKHMNVKALARKGDLDAAIAKAEEISANNSPVASMAAQDLERLREIKNKGGLQKNEGFLYKIDLPDEDIGKMLDWDKRYNEQPQQVQDAIKNSNLAELWQAEYGHDIEKSQPQMDLIYKAVANQLGGFPAASKYFRELGIPGTKYMDKTSNMDGAATNFVTFPSAEDGLTILERNGQKIAPVFLPKN